MEKDEKVVLVMEKVVLASKKLFQPVNGVRSTHLLVEIHNRYKLKFSKKVCSEQTDYENNERSWVEIHQH